VPNPSLCLALPGLNYTPQTTYVIASLPLARALQRHFDVRLLFRSLLVLPAGEIPIDSILEHPDVPESVTGSARNYFIGGSLGARRAYLRRLEALPRSLGARFLIERQWAHVGRLAGAASATGLTAALVSEGEFYDGGPAPHSPVRALRQWLDGRMQAESRARGYREADVIVPETAVHRDAIARGFGPTVAAKCVPIGVGIDPAIFRPLDRPKAQAALGFAADKLHLLYLGSLNGSIQSPDQAIEGLAQAQNPALLLHIVGTGDQAAALEARARALGAPVVFHGFRPQAEASAFIAASDLTLAPYRAALFKDGVFTSGSCKIREYLASGRPVLTIPGETTRALTHDETYGFLRENDAASYAAMFRALKREALREKEDALLRDLALGRLRERAITPSWDDVADRFAEALFRADAAKR